MLLINIDLNSLTRTGEVLDNVLRDAAQRGARELVPAVHAHILEEANKKLHSRREPFVRALSMRQEGESTYLIVLDQSARWIEDGTEPHEMIDDLLSQRGKGKSKPKRAKDGSMYRVVPFFHGPGKGAASSTPAEQTLQATIKEALKTSPNKWTQERGIPYGKIERDSEGKPRLGLLHSVKLPTPAKTAHGPGQGWGPIGAQRQGATGIPFLQGLRIYQRQTQNPDGTSSVKRAIMTFRMVSSKHKGSGRWFHPGLKPVHIIDDAHRWGLDHWEKVVLPKVVDYVLANS